MKKRSINISKIIFLMLILVTALSIFTSCTPSLVLRPVDYAWNLESVLKVDKDMYVKGAPKTLGFNVYELFKAEKIDLKISEDGREVRLIRDNLGYFYIIAEGFTNVYVFRTGENSLDLFRKITIDKDGVNKPRLNFREPNVQLLYNNGKDIMMDNKGIVFAGDVK